MVDDKAAFQRHGGVFLRAAGNRVITAGEAQMARVACVADQPSDVIVELAMPPRFVNAILRQAIERTFQDLS